MKGVQKNLFVRLHKWAVRQDENFLTESFAYLIEYLVANEPEAASSIVSHLTCGIINLPSNQIQLLEVQTQSTGEEGIPDLNLRTKKHFVIIEVKSEAEVTEIQLRRYRLLLDHSEASLKGLILLTRYPALISGADHYIRWYHVAEWIHLESMKYKFKTTSQFLVDQFLGFLEARSMTMEQITWEMTTGVRSLRSFLDMLYEAASACGLKRYKEGSHNYMAITIDGGLYWAGIEFENPENLIFATDKANVSKEIADEVGVGTTYEKDKTRFGWRSDVNLESEEVHFFARSKASQMQFLEQFLRENYELAKKITLKEATENLPAPQSTQNDN